MNWLEELLPPLLHDGSLVFRVAPDEFKVSTRTQQFLFHCFQSHQLRIAGPSIEFEEHAAIRAALLVIRASWLLFQPVQLRTKQEAWLAEFPAPVTPSEHLSADMFLRYLPVVLRRGRARAETRPLVNRIETILRDHPFSGVLANLSLPPTCPVLLGRHHGLALEYVERWQAFRNPAWRIDESLREYEELLAADAGVPPVPQT